MSFSVLDYDFSVLHEKSVNFKYSFYHLSNFLWSIRCTINSICFSAMYFITSISDSLINACGYILALVIRPLVFGYLAVEAGLH